MENQPLLMVYLATWVFYVLGIHWFVAEVGPNGRAAQIIVGVSHAVPSLVALLMTYIFVIGQGATIAQFTAGSEHAMSLWSLWHSQWPVLLLSTFTAGLLQAVWTVVAGLRPEWRGWLPIAGSGAAMCAFAFMTVVTNFPDA